MALSINTDASAFGWGAVFGEKKAHGFLSLPERETSSCERELMAIHRALLSFAPELRGSRVRILSDSQNAAAVTDHGSSKLHLQKLALDIFWLCHQSSISLTVDWIPRGLNTEADALSKWEDSNDWQLYPSWFKILDRRFGPHQVDRFASADNNRLPRFNSFFHCPGSEAVDCFTQTWTPFTNWCNPPFCVIGKLLRFLVAQQANATMIVPCWKTAVWWPILCPTGVAFAAWVEAATPLPRSRDLFLPGKAAGNAFGVGCPRWDVMAVKIAFHPRLIARGKGPPVPFFNM